MGHDDRIRVLYVDDEANNLISFKANFRKYYDVFTADSAQEGKKILATQDIHVIITDQRMPRITGVQFLESIIRDYPFPTRIILTGYADLETVIEAINKGQIYRYIMKPFDASELKTIIDSAYDTHLFRRSSDAALGKFRQLFENSNDAIFVMDTNGQFQELNYYGLNLFKIQRSNLRSVSLGSLFHDSNDYTTFYAQLMKNEPVIDFPAKLKDNKNNLLESLISATPIKEEQNLIGYQCMIRDITKQKEMENLVIRTIIETQESERIRLGKNLHDSIGQKLSAIKLFLQEIAKNNEHLKKNEVLLKSGEVIDSSITELRNICFNIMPKTLEILGLKGALNELRNQNEVPGVFEFNIDFPDGFLKLNINMEIAIFRIVQEFLSNAITHGKARQVDLIFRPKMTKLNITLRDNGKGFNAKLPIAPSKMGLKNIRSRVQSYNGDIKIASAPGKGTEIDIEIPIDAPILN